MASERKRNIVIIGGGIIGCTTAYFLTRHPAFKSDLHKITLLEATSIAAGASGKAGGLLALWAYPECLVPLSFQLHAKLAAEHDGPKKWGYRKVKCGSISATVTKEKLAGMAKRKRELELEENEATKAAATKDVPEAVPLGKEKDVEPAAVTEDNAGAAIGNETSTNENKQSERRTKDTESKENAASEGEPSATKDWEKLPKQDETAAALLEDCPLPNDLTWIDPTVIEGYCEMGGPTTADTAQVHPLHFTTAMASLAAEAGVDIKIKACVTKILASKTAIEGVEYLDRKTSESHVLKGVTDVVVCAGPWTGKLLPRTKVEGLRAHSVVWEADVSPYAVFTDIDLPVDYLPEHRARKGQKRRHKGRVDPEIYARPFNEVYACGEPDSSIPLPETADLVQVDPSQCDDLVAYTSTISSQLRDAPVKAKQSCYLPRHMRFGEEIGPLIGPTSVAGLWIASGHTCWGIQNGPATGFLMAEYLLEGIAKSAKVEKLDPRKFKV